MMEEKKSEDKIEINNKESLMDCTFYPKLENTESKPVQ